MLCRPCSPRSNLSIQMAFLLLCIEVILAAIPVSVLAATYAISPGWDIVNSSTVRVTGEYPLDKGYYLVNNGSMDIVSENGMFALVFNKANYPSDGLILVVKSNNSRVLFIDRVGYQNPLEDINSIGMDECGKTLIYNGYKDYELRPTSCILPIMCSTSRGLACSNCNYSARVYDGGLALEFMGQIYGAWSLADSAQKKIDESDLLISKCAGRRAFMAMKNGSLTLQYGQTSGPDDCLIPPLALPFRKLQRSDNTLVQPFLRMTEFGDLGLYTFDEKNQTWVVDSVLALNMVCKSMLSCGPDNVCDLNGNCNNSLAIGNTVHGLRDLSYARQHKLAWNTTGVGYISTRFSKPYNTRSLDACKNLSDRMPKCSALFYDHSTGNCYLMDAFPAGSLHRDDNMTVAINFTVWRRWGQIQILALVLLCIGIIIAAVYLTVTPLATLLLSIKVHKVNPAKEVENLLSKMQGLPQRFTYMELDAATWGFKTKLGTGGFGSVYEGFTEDARHVAVKKLDDNGTESAKHFVTELAGIGGVNHYNIVKLRGFCIEGATQKLLVYEFMPNGSLDRWLFGNDSTKTLSWEQRFSVSLGTARGLFYLHEECSEPILHLDIKPQNILLDSKFEAKVADFGVAKMLANRDVTHVDTNIRGTPGYMAPEWLLQYAATKKCDVYSYGMLLLELIGGRKNIDFLKICNEDASWYFPAWVVDRVKENKLLEVVDPRLERLAPIDDVTMMVRIALWCIQDNPATRPSMGQIMEMLNRHRPVDEPPMSFYFADNTGLNSKRLFSTS